MDGFRVLQRLDRGELQLAARRDHVVDDAGEVLLEVVRVVFDIRVVSITPDS